MDQASECKILSLELVFTILVGWVVESLLNYPTLKRLSTMEIGKRESKRELEEVADNFKLVAGRKCRLVCSAYRTSTRISRRWIHYIHLRVRP
jgi:hypothetical protein